MSMSDVHYTDHGGGDFTVMHTSHDETGLTEQVLIDYDGYTTSIMHWFGPDASAPRAQTQTVKLYGTFEVEFLVQYLKQIAEDRAK